MKTIQRFAVDIETAPYSWTRYKIANDKKEAEKYRRKARNETGYRTRVYCFEMNVED